jgi:elongation factor P
MVLATEVRKGMFIRWGGELYLVTGQHHQKMQNRRPIVILKIKGLVNGLVREEKLSSGDTVEQAVMEKREMEYLYSTDREAVFMNVETYDQVSIPLEMVREELLYLRINDRAEVVFNDGNPISLNLPAAVMLQVRETEPEVKGATATNVQKPAVLETGLKVRVPPFIAQGERVKIDTRTGEYLGRGQE